MTAKPNEDAVGSWFGDDYDQLDRLGGSGDRQRTTGWKDDAGEEARFSRHPLPVVMETASTVSDPFKKSEGDLYTSLLSNQDYSFNQDSTSSTYLSGELESKRKSPFGATDDLISGLESHAMFSSDSGIEMTPGEPTDLVSHKLQDSEKTMTSDQAYSYMDISCREDPHGQAQKQPSPLDDWGMCGTTASVKIFSGLPEEEGDYLEKGAAEAETLGSALDARTFPYVEEPSDEELSDYQPYRSPGAGSSASPVKITLTESPPRSISPTTEGWQAAPVAVSEKESILSLGLEGVPTVTLSEPEDESPGSSTPPLTEESDSPSEPRFHADDKPFGSTQDKSPSTAPAQLPKLASQTTGPSVPTPTQPRSSHDVEGSSGGESGDSEIELVSEEPVKQPASSSYMSFSKPPGPTVPRVSAPSPAPAPNPTPAPTPLAAMQYSILREEREAELDSELALESCGEESPKRGLHQDFTLSKGQKPEPSLLKASPAPATPPAPPPTPAPAPKEKSPSVSSVEEVKAKPSATSSAPLISVAPELKVDKPTAEERHGERRLSGHGRPAPPPAIFQGLTREKAMELLYWRDVKQSGLLFGSVMLLLFSLTQFSVVSVVAYLALAALSATISFRVYKSVLQAVQKTDEGHPFKAYLDMEVSMSQDQMQKYAENVQYYLNSTLKELRRLFLVQDLVDSLKFAVLMWLLTYVGALFNGLTLLILAVVSMFSMPVVYEKYQAQIDQYLGLIRTQVNSVVGKIQEKIPGAKRKAE
ncbi:reticulon-1b isoform X1 [Denticeps clupeoides]|uniref:Reticulon n=1 Tax=Denticeps clupeoides TaxID=299321 RepID=A0AAY4AX68_9TELE|nr:reticulon-1 isoform X1 [Denticeps clupeoides]